MAISRNKVGEQGSLTLDCPLRGNVHGDRSLMDFPFFALEKTAQADTIEYQIGDVRITVRAGKSGIATMYDKEIILYVASLIFERKMQGRDYSQVMSFTAHDFFRATGAMSPGKRDYQRFNDALARLQGTQIQTNLETGGIGHRGWFSWIENAEVIYEKGAAGVEKLRAVKVRLCEFLFRAIDRDTSMYSYHHEYFKLGVIERRLYEIARANCNPEVPYEMSLERLYATVGSRGSRIRRFKERLANIQAEDSLPQYQIQIQDVIDGKRVTRADKTFVTFKERPRSPEGKGFQILLDLIDA